MLFLKKHVLDNPLLRYQKLLGMPVGSDQTRFRVTCFIPRTNGQERHSRKTLFKQGSLVISFHS